MARRESAEYEIRLKDNLSNPLDKAISRSSRLDSNMSKVGRSAQRTQSVFAGMLGANVFMQLANGAAQFASFAVKAGVQMEQTRISFQTMVGDIERGNKLFAEVAEFANVTPFSTVGVQKAGRTLLAFGVQADAIIPTLSTLGDISAGTGKDLSELGVIYGQIRGAGRLMGQDLLQLINAGFNPLQQISKRTGESMSALKKRMSEGKISFAEVQQSFVDATSAGGIFYQMSEKQSKTLGGLWSTLAGKFQNSVATFMEGNSGFLKSIVAGTLEVFTFFETKFAGVKAVFQPLFDLISETQAEFAKLFDGMGEGVTVTSFLEGAFNALGTTIRFLMPVFRVMARSFLHTWTLITRTTSALVNWYKQSETAQMIFKGFVSSIVAGFVLIKETATNLLSGVGDLLAGIFTGNVEMIKSGLAGLDTMFDDAGSEAAKAFEESFNTKSQDFFADTEKKEQKTQTFGNLSQFIEKSPEEQAAGKAGKKASSSVGGVASGRPTTVNIDIGKLIETFIVETSNIQDLENQVKKAVSRALVSAVNDVNLVAK